LIVIWFGEHVVTASSKLSEPVQAELAVAITADKTFMIFSFSCLIEKNVVRWNTDRSIL